MLCLCRICLILSKSADIAPTPEFCYSLHAKTLEKKLKRAPRWRWYLIIMSNAPCYTSVFKVVYIYMRIAEICHYLSSIQRWDNFSSVVDNLQDVLVEEGQSGKGQKIQEDSAAKTMIFLLKWNKNIAHLRNRRFNRYLVNISSLYCH